MTKTILFKSGKEVSIKCRDASTTSNEVTGRAERIHFDGVKENLIMDIDFAEVAAIYRKISDEVTE